MEVAQRLSFLNDATRSSLLRARGLRRVTTFRVGPFCRTSVLLAALSSAACAAYDKRAEMVESSDPCCAEPSVAQEISTGLDTPQHDAEETSEVDIQQPFGWKTGSWGSLQMRSSAVQGEQNNVALTLTVSSYVSGDAKWFYEPQPVVPATRYLYSDRYTATVTSFMTARLLMKDGTFKFLPLVRVPASATPAIATFTFEAPADSVSATVMHGLALNGTLTFDKAALKILRATPVTFGVPNSGLEISDFAGSTTPSAWLQNRWGDHDGSFAYRTDGHTGDRSIAVAITTHRQGRAGWYFEPQAIDPVAPYVFSNYYRANVDTWPLVVATLSDGSVANVQLPVALAAAQWTKYQSDLFLPLNTVRFTVHHQLTGVGELQTDDYSVTPCTDAPFQRGIASIVFDDSWRTDFTLALPVLSRHRAVATHYAITGSLGAGDRLTTAMLTELKARGHEIAAHTKTHSDLRALAPNAVLDELQTSKAVLEAAGLGPIDNFAAPYGLYSAEVLKDAARLFRSHRSVDLGYNSRCGFNPMLLKVQSLRSTTTLAEVQAWVARAAADRTWLILLYHDLASRSGSIYSTSPEALDAHVSAIKAAGLPILTVTAALNELMPQRLMP